MQVLYINMTTTLGATDWIPIGPKIDKASISIQIGSDFAWGDTEIDLQFTPARGFDEKGRELEFASNYVPAIQFTTDVRSRRNLSVSGSGFIRLRTTTAVGGSDPNAQVVVLLS